MSISFDVFLWCLLQVTIFSLVTWAICWCAARYRRPLALPVVFTGLLLVGILTLSMATPWAWWSWNWPMPSRSTTEFSTPSAIDVAVSGFVSRREPNALASGELPKNVGTKTPEASAFGSHHNNSRVLGQIIDETVSDEFVPSSTQAPNEPTAIEFARGLTTDATFSSNIRIRWKPVLVGIAIAAIVVGLVRLVLAMFWLRSYRQSCLPINDPGLQQTADTISKKMGMPRPTQVCESSTVEGPATIGWWRPLILLPPNWRNWTADQRTAVLAHELAHVQHRHFAQWMLGQAVLAANYYHPLVHALAQRLRLEQEIVADNHAADILGNRQHYAAALASLALRPAAASRLGLAPGLFMSQSLLMRRFAMLKKPAFQILPRWNLPRIIALLSLLAIGIAVSGIRGNSPGVAAFADDSQPVEGALASKPEEGAYSTVTALFQVSSDSPRLLFDVELPEDKKRFEILQKTQLALLRSHFVQQGAIRDPAISKLPVMLAQQDPVAWLAGILDVTFPRESEILRISISCKQDEAEQYRKIVDAIAESYHRHVQYSAGKKDQQRRDKIGRSLDKLQKEIRRKMEDFEDLANDLGISHGENSTTQKLNMSRLARVEDEIMRLEGEQLMNELQPGDAKRALLQRQFFVRRIGQLRTQQSKLEEEIADSSETSVELSVREDEITQLKEVAKELALRIKTMDIEANAPSRITLIQPALITYHGEDAIVVSDQNLMVLAFLLPSTGPGRKMAVVAERLIDGGVPIRMVDIDKSPDMAADFDISQSPAFVVVVDDEVVDVLDGATTYEAVKEWIEKTTAKSRVEARAIR